jgi:hypothetical protein
MNPDLKLNNMPQNRRSKVAYSKKLYRQRYRVENLFCHINRWVCFSQRRDKLAQTSPHCSRLPPSST